MQGGGNTVDTLEVHDDLSRLSTYQARTTNFQSGNTFPKRNLKTFRKGKLAQSQVLGEHSKRTCNSAPFSLSA
jgi:hypothetical protein